MPLSLKSLRDTLPDCKISKPNRSFFKSLDSACTDKEPLITTPELYISNPFDDPVPTLFQEIPPKPDYLRHKEGLETTDFPCSKPRCKGIIQVIKRCTPSYDSPAETLLLFRQQAKGQEGVTTDMRVSYGEIQDRWLDMGYRKEYERFDERTKGVKKESAFLAKVKCTQCKREKYDFMMVAFLDGGCGNREGEGRVHFAIERS